MPTTTSNDELPGVLFLCVRNKGKSQMAAALARLRGKGVIRAYSAGTHPGDAINQASAESVAELGADMSGETPQGVLLVHDPALPLADRAAATIWRRIRPRWR